MIWTSSLWSRTALLVLLVVGLLGAGVASAHHHDETASPAEECGMCLQAASVAAGTASAPSLESPAPSRCVVSAELSAIEEGCRTEPRGRGPPSFSSLL